MGAVEVLERLLGGGSSGSHLEMSCLLLISIILLSSGPSPAQAIQEFKVYRMQQFELQGISRGSKASSFSGEALSWTALRNMPRAPGSVALLRITELDFLRDCISKGINAVVIILPAISNLPTEHLALLERTLYEESLQVPVYFIKEDRSLVEIYSSLPATGQNLNFNVEHIWFGTSTQFTVSAATPKQVQKAKLATLSGKLSGFGLEEQLPTITVVAHYDTAGAAPQLSYGVDSNGSGAAALFELMRIMSKLYANSKTHPRANIQFVLSAGGKINYLGTKKWIEDSVEGSNQESLLQDSLFSICIEGIGNGDQVFTHVSKPPSADHPMRKFFNLMNSTKGHDIRLVHKKINLNSELRAWEHERFSMNRLPAFTFSAFNSFDNPLRQSVFDTKVDMDVLTRNVQLLASSLALTLYNQTPEQAQDLLAESLAVDRSHLEAWIKYFSKEPRAAQLVLHKSEVVSTLKEFMNKYLSQVKVSLFEPDKREPEIVYYDVAEATLQANRVKPALFDFALALLLGAYLAAVYFALSKFHCLVSLFSSKSKKVD